jgi:tripartite-type tricarboxylate transporter receptor subunit TctC
MLRRTALRYSLVMALLLTPVFEVLTGLQLAHAQSGPNIRIIFPFPAGGSGDATVRLLADQLQTRLGQPVIVENRVGAAGRIGVVAVKNADPDGTTLLFTPFAAVTLYPIVYRQIDYDPFKDLAPVTQVSTYDFAIAVNADHPAKTPQELIAWLKANPTKAQFGSPGAGALPHFFGLLVGRAAGVEMTHIAYKGTPPSLTDLMAGQIPMATSTTSEFVELHRAGKIRVIATSGKERLPQLPDVPTFLESGIDIVGLGWYGIFAPAKTPEAVISRLNKALVAALAQPDMQEKLQIFGLTPTGTTPQELAAIQKADLQLWSPVVKASGFIAD